MENKYSVTLRTITPLMIGDGSKIYPFEYWTEGNTILVGDFNKLIDALSGDLEKNHQKIIELINQKTNFMDILTALGMEALKKGFFLKTIKSDERLSTEIESFISHPNGKHYIPGSSIKGAIMIAIISEEVDDEKIRDVYNKYDTLPRNTFGRKTNIFVSDGEKGSITAKVCRLNRIGMSVRRNNPYVPFHHKTVDKSQLGAAECIEGQFMFAIKSKLSKEDLIRKVNNFYKNSISEIKKISAVQNNAELIGNLSIIENAFRDNHMVLQLGHYGNYFTKSYGVNIKKSDIGRQDEGLIKLRRMYGFGKAPGKYGKFNEEFPKTFPLTSTNMPLGWVSIEFDS